MRGGDGRQPRGTYRTVWALKKHYPHIKVYARATDVAQGLELERAGARAVVPETLEPSLQLGAAILGEMEMSNEDISIAVDTFRRSHMGELQMLAANSGPRWVRPPHGPAVHRPRRVDGRRRAQNVASA